MSQPGSLDQAGQAAGFQAQFNLLLKLLAQIAGTLSGPGNPYGVSAWTIAGNLVISTAFPSLQNGTISIRQAIAAAINVTLPGYGGPWTIVDGAGVAAAHNITVLAPAGFTIEGGASFVISANWGAAMFVLDGTNYIVV
jgi:hypothetical protein